VRVLVIDNYDSFAYNLVQYVGEVVTDPEWGVVDEEDAGEVLVRRNDAVTLADVDEIDPDGVVVSPGPGTPADAGVSMPLFADRSYPTLGVCLGHQALCAANGAPVGHAEAVVHGKPSTVAHDGTRLFADLPDRFEVGRYHSLAVERTDIPDVLVETAWTVTHEGTESDDGAGGAAADGPDDAADPSVVMGVRHGDRPHYGVQFHPESILTDTGKRLIAAFCHRCTTTT